MKISKDMLEGLYGGLSIGVGIVGFILVSTVIHAVFPAWGPLTDFGCFLWLAGWAASWTIYLTLYIFGAFVLWPFVRKTVLGNGKDY